MREVEIVPTEFTSERETIRGFFVTPKGDGPFPGICKFHGIPGGPDIVGGLATKLAENGFACLTFDFRGFRSSDGVFFFKDQIKDAQVAISHLLESDLTIDNWSGVYAASWGAAVAICALAEDKRPDALCLRAPVYDTLWFSQTPIIRPAAEELRVNDPSQIRGLDNPEIFEEILRRMVEDSRIHNPINEISKISPTPLLIIHGTDDVGIPLAGVKRLYELAGEPKDLVVVEGADHNLSDQRAYEITMSTVVDWFKKKWNAPRNES